MLETSERTVAITTVDSDVPFLSFKSAGLRTRIRIWHDHPRWPETVTIGVD
jgi:hypothetical protein